jgi:uncharacterized protein (TIGR03000 family)
MILGIAGLFSYFVAVTPVFAQCAPYQRIVFVPGGSQDGSVAVRVVPAGTPAAEIRHGAPAKGEPGYYTEDYAPAAKEKPAPNKARIRVRLPAKAELWLDGKKLSLTGTVREFTTPDLKPDKVYSFLVKSRWVDEDGITVEKSLRVRTFSGTRVTVNFVRTRPSFVGTATPAPISAPQPVYRGGWGMSYGYDN